MRFGKYILAVLLLTLSVPLHAQLLLLGAGSPRVASGGVGARVTNGTSDSIKNTTAYLSGATTFTVAFWFKPANLTQTNKYLLVARSGANSIEWAVIWEFVNNRVEFFDTGGSGATDPRVSSAITISDTNWHHIAYRYDGAAWDRFLDGTKTSINASATFTLPTITISPELSIGCEDNGAGGCGSFVSAAFSRVYISTAALTDGQITALAGATCSSSGVSGTIGYWLLGGASPEPESSPSGNTNSLTLTGTTTTTGPTCSGS